MNIEEKYESETSFSHWLVPEFPFNLILDFSNFITLTILLFFISKKLQLNFNLYFIFALMMLTPFLFNGSLLEWTNFPDQSKYISAARDIRSNLLYPQNIIDQFKSSNRITVNFSAAIYSLFPSTNFETYRSIGFLNRFLLILIIAFCISKKTLPASLKIFLILSPSLTLYSSISLREVLILFIMVFLTYNIIIKNKSYTSILAISLLIIKPQNLLIVVVPFLLQEVFSTKKTKKNYLFIILSLIISLILILNYAEIFNKINSVSYGFFFETYGGYQGSFIKEQFIKYTPSNILSKLGLGISKVLISPFPNISSASLMIIFFENLIIYTLIYHHLFKELFKKNFDQKIKLFWIITLLFSLIMYSIVSFNDGTIHRYKLVILGYILIGYNLHRSSYKLNI
ncbi:hypothetical protein N9407_00650 [Candidatus Pelagibacter sp.]|nr:hypothetical protein [Candidatus Pelagibacter sp.]